MTFVHNALADWLYRNRDAVVFWGILILAGAGIAQGWV